ncbi:MarR family winged helix-turn-helix transcriptional regulator [Faecalimonas sp.]
MNENKIIHKLLEVFEYKNKYQFQTSNIPSQDMYVLERIYYNKKLTIKEISKKYNIPPSTLTGIIDRLENKKLIQRFRKNTDRRTIELVTTPEGNTIVKKHIEEDELFSINLFNSLEKTKKETLKKLLEELLQNIEKDSLFSQNKTL